MKGKLWGCLLIFTGKALLRKKSLNATFIGLLPKMAGGDFKQFRPISLVETVYKILAKVLASRLRKVIGRTFGPSQYAFILGR